VFRGKLKKQEGANNIIDVFLEHEVYNRLKAYQTKRGLDEGTTLVEVLERGMATYWLQVFKQLKKSHAPIRKMFLEFKRDNETLKAIESENERFAAILEENRKTKGPRA